MQRCYRFGIVGSHGACLAMCIVVGHPTCCKGDFGTCVVYVPKGFVLRMHVMRSTRGFLHGHTLPYAPFPMCGELAPFPLCREGGTLNLSLRKPLTENYTLRN